MKQESKTLKISFGDILLQKIFQNTQNSSVTSKYQKTYVSKNFLEFDFTYDCKVLVESDRK